MQLNPNSVFLKKSRQQNQTLREADKLSRVISNKNKRKLIAPDRRQSKTLILSTNADQKSIETVFLIGIATNDNRKLCFYRLLIYICRWYQCFRLPPINVHMIFWFSSPPINSHAHTTSGARDLQLVYVFTLSMRAR